MGRPRGKSGSRSASRLLKATSSSSSSVNVMNLQMPPLTSAAIPRLLEEDLESQARVSLSLFGFGSVDAVNWSMVTGGSVPESTPHTQVTLLERVCPVGTNTFLWNTLSNHNSSSESLTGLASGGNELSAALFDIAGNGGLATTNTNANNSNLTGGNDIDGLDWDPAGFANVFSSKVLQQYLVKCTAVLPSTVAEVVDLIIRSDREDMETAMHHLVGIRASASGFIYCRKHKKRRQQHHNTATNRSSLVRQMRSRSSTLDDDNSDSSFSDSDEELVGTFDENLTFNDQNRLSESNFRYRPTRGDSLDQERLTTSTTTNSLSATYMEDYRAGMAASGNQGNLSIKWVVGEKSGRMFTSRANYCLLDYECIMVNDWEEGADRSPMYVRALQSCYLPQCQPWVEELGVKPTDLQPTGIMVRQARGRDGYVEVQFVASILEKAQLPINSRRAKLRSLCAKIAKLEEVITSRRLSQSLLANQPLWVLNRERPGCSVCDAKFGLSRRRHHCRLCGEICCSECCPKMDVVLPDVGTTSVRVCVVCVRKRRQSTESVGSSSSSSNNNTATVSPTNKTSHQPQPSPPLAPPPTALPSPSDYYLPTSSSSSSVAGLSIAGGLASGGGNNGLDRKASLASSVFQKLKSVNG